MNDVARPLLPGQVVLTGIDAGSGSRRTREAAIWRWPGFQPDGY